MKKENKSYLEQINEIFTSNYSVNLVNNNESSEERSTKIRRKQNKIE